ncbi:hypothetical protein HanIR_Chr06g0279531 [Helianthus annuus]|nr:hypothetical protein HanIR_Chr06g0279531 [Helianthus annuus]
MQVSTFKIAHFLFLAHLSPSPSLSILCFYFLIFYFTYNTLEPYPVLSVLTSDH